MEDKSHILQLIKKSVAQTAPGATLILYGSYARGDNLVLIDKDKITLDDRKKISSPLYRIELETGIIISPFLYSKSAWGAKHRITPFYENVTREGIIL